MKRTLLALTWNVKAAIALRRKRAVGANIGKMGVVKMTYKELVDEWSTSYNGNPHFERRPSFAVWLVDKINGIISERDNWRKQALDEGARANALEARLAKLEAQNATR